MISINILPRVAAIAALLLILLVLMGVAASIQELRVDAQCAALGWRDSNVTWNFKAYCIRRVNQTDVVVPLDSARALRKAGR